MLVIVVCAVYCVPLKAERYDASISAAPSLPGYPEVQGVANRQYYGM